MKYPTIAGDLADMHHSITWKRVCEAVYRRLVSLDNPGFCLDCGADADGPTRATTGATAAGFAPCSALMRCC